MTTIATVKSNLDQEMHQEEMKELSKSFAEQRMRFVYQIAQDSAKKDYFLNRDFYIVLVPTNTRDTQMLPMDLPFVRRSCPSPGYNQNVWKYHHKTGTLEFLWSIPRKAIYYWLYNNRYKYMNDPVLKSRTVFVVSMESGKLLEWVKKENGELPDAVIKVNQSTNEPVIA